MLDEAHERTVNAAVLFGLLKELHSRPDLSGRNLVHQRAGERRYGGGNHHLDEDPSRLSRRRHLWYFWPAWKVIDTCCWTLCCRVQALGDLAPNGSSCPSHHSALLSEIQIRIIDPAPRRPRKVFIDLNLARGIADHWRNILRRRSRLSKQKAVYSKFGLGSLLVSPISLASAKQRA
jgi:hypothetical protein